MKLFIKSFIQISCFESFTSLGGVIIVKFFVVIP